MELILGAVALAASLSSIGYAAWIDREMKRLKRDLLEHVQSRGATRYVIVRAPRP